MPVIKLTKREIDKIKPQAKDVEYWDSDDQGFYLKVTPAGTRAFYLFYRNSYGQKRKYHIGKLGPLTPDQARDKAVKLLGEIADGGDPAADKRQAKQASSFSELAEKYLDEYARVHKKPRSLKDDEYNLNRFLKKTFGSQPVAAITRADVLRFHHSLRKTPVPANRCLALLSKMFNLAEAWGIRPSASNPCQHVKKFPENKRERYLNAVELSSIAGAIDKLEKQWREKQAMKAQKALSGEEKELSEDDCISPAAAAALRLLILTGCRCGEILALRWENVDLEDRCLRLPDSKTGAKTVHLNSAAVEILKNLPKHESGWVIPGRKPNKPMVNIHKPWERVCSEAKIEGLRLHDLRHSFASVAAGQGQSLLMIGKLLGHTQAQTTQRYAHLLADPVKAAAEAIGEEISLAMRGKVAEVVDMAAERAAEPAARTQTGTV